MTQETILPDTTYGRDAATEVDLGLLRWPKPRISCRQRRVRLQERPLAVVPSRAACSRFGIVRQACLPRQHRSDKAGAGIPAALRPKCSRTGTPGRRRPDTVPTVRIRIGDIVTESKTSRTKMSLRSQLLPSWEEQREADAKRYDAIAKCLGSE